jgi:hypothetical protein
MNRRNLFAVITKIDESKREVHGCLAEEKIDGDDEIMDYELSKPYFEKWNADFAQKTDGKSVGNLRAMHNKIAAGKFVAMEYDDAEKKILVVAKVTDEQQWENVVEGVYTGFSIGARRVKTWIDRPSGAKRWIADPFEGSLVDNPCMKGATFTLIKADGTESATKFKHAEAGTEIAEKGLYQVSWFAQCAAMIHELAVGTEYEKQIEGDDSEIPKQIRSLAKKLGDLLVRYTQEEVDEANQATEEVASMSDKAKKTIAAPGVRPAEKIDEPAAAAPAVAAVPDPAAAPATTETPAAVPAAPAAVAATEAPAAISAEDRKTLETASSVITRILSGTPAAEPKAAAASAEVEKNKSEFVTKAEFETMKTQIAERDAALDAANKAMESILNRPAPTPVKINGVIVKKSDGGDGAVEIDPSKLKPLDVIKAVHAAGPGIRHAVQE